MPDFANTAHYERSLSVLGQGIEEPPDLSSFPFSGLSKPFNSYNPYFPEHQSVSIIVISH
jgi:hypothetical protein